MTNRSTPLTSEKVVPTNVLKREELHSQLAILRALFTTEQTALMSWREWEAEYDLLTASYQTKRMLPLLAWKIRQQSEVKVASLDSIYLSTLANGIFKLNRCTGFMREAIERGCRLRVLKGLAMLEYYPSIGCREMADLDFYLSKPDALLSIEFLQRESWSVEEEGWELEEGLTRHHSVLFKDSRGGSIDLHWHVFFEHPNADVDSIFFLKEKELPIEGLTCFTPDPAALLVHACVNGLRYSTVNQGYYWAIDVLVLANAVRWSFDWNRVASIAQQAAALHLMEEAFSFLDTYELAVVPKSAWSALKCREPIILERWHKRLKPNEVDGPLGGLAFRIHGYYRNNPPRGLFRDIVGLLQELKMRWHVRALWQLPLAIFRSRYSKWRRHG